MDKKTGFLWMNLNYFNYKKNEDTYYSLEEAKEIVKNLKVYEYNNWKIPSKEQIIKMIDDKEFFFKKGIIIELMSIIIGSVLMIVVM